MTSTEYELHPLCTLFPRLGDEEAARLAEDIKANGLREPITLCGGMILDGGNRYRACVDAGIKPTFKEYKGDSIVQFVLSANLHRRHLSAGQQAAIVASAQDWANAQPVGGTGANQHTNKEQTGNVAGLLFVGVLVCARTAHGLSICPVLRAGYDGCLLACRQVPPMQVRRQHELHDAVAFVFLERGLDASVNARPVPVATIKDHPAAERDRLA